MGKLGVEKFNPLVFALIREVAAGALLLLWALRRDGCVPLRRGRDAYATQGSNPGLEGSRHVCYSHV